MPKKGYKQTKEHKKKLEKNLSSFKNGYDQRRHNDVKIKGDRKRYFRNRDLKWKFGITIEEYEIMLDAQGNRCAICGGYQVIKGDNLYVDHDHITGRIRGLLCHYCNVGIGMLKDNPQILQNAIDYLSLDSRNSDFKDRVSV